MSGIEDIDVAEPSASFQSYYSIIAVQTTERKKKQEGSTWKDERIGDDCE